MAIDTTELLALPLGEKMRLVELLWDNLARSPEIVESPGWHESILNERGQRAADGTSEFTDWESAKMEIRSRVIRRLNRSAPNAESRSSLHPTANLRFGDFPVRKL